MDDNGKSILFFDGVCGMCNRLVDWVMRHDTRGRIKVAAIQGETAKEELMESDREDLNSVVYLNHLGSFRKSSAIARLLWDLGGFWKFVGWMLWLVPKPLRNLGYSIVAKNRYRVFGKKEACRMPTPEERARFLP